MRKDRDQSKLIKSINYQLLTRQLQGRIKQREKTVVTICHLGQCQSSSVLLFITCMFIFKLFIIINYHLKTNEIILRRFGDIMTPLSRNEKYPLTPCR